MDPRGGDPTKAVSFSRRQGENGRREFKTKIKSQQIGGRVAQSNSIRHLIGRLGREIVKYDSSQFNKGEQKTALYSEAICLSVRENRSGSSQYKCVGD